MPSTASIEQLVADGLVDEIVQQVKTGKEAEVYVVRKGTEYLAAKVYKERNQRNFKNNIGYMEGRTVRNSRDMRAMNKRTKYGVDKAETEWMHTEHDALVTVTHAGVRAPRPELFYEGVLLMELVLGTDGQPAPRLIDVPLTTEEALAHHRDIVGMIVKMLCCDLIHGDLSPYNILLAWNGPTIIDLPQVVKAAHNSQAEQFLVRDVRNVTEHFARYAPELKKRMHDGYAIWKKYMRRELAPDYFPEEGTVAPTREFVPGQTRAPRPQKPAAPARAAAHEARPHHPREHRPAAAPAQNGAPAAKHAPSATTHRPAAAKHAPSATTHRPAATTHGPSATTHRPAATTHRPAAREHVPSATGTGDEPKAHPAGKPHHGAGKPHHPAAKPHHPAAKPHHGAGKPHHPASKPHHTSARPHHAAAEGTSSASEAQGNGSSGSGRFHQHHRRRR